MGTRLYIEHSLKTLAPLVSRSGACTPRSEPHVRPLTVIRDSLFRFRNSGHSIYHGVALPAELQRHTL